VLTLIAVAVAAVIFQVGGSVKAIFEKAEALFAY